MSIIEFKSQVSYHQFLNVEETLIVLQVNNIDAEIVNHEEIQISDHETGEPIEFYKNDYIFFHDTFELLFLTGNDSIILGSKEGKELVNRLIENNRKLQNAILSNNCPLSISGNCKALEGK